MKKEAFAPCAVTRGLVERPPFLLHTIKMVVSPFRGGKDRGGWTLHGGNRATATLNVAK